MISYIEEYKNAIDRGEIIVGWKIKKVLEIVLGYMSDPTIIYDPRHAHKRMKWQEQYSLQGKKPFYKKPISFMLWQRFIWETVYGFYDKETGLRLINEMFLEVARKNGKSTLVASMVQKG